VAAACGGAPTDEAASATDAAGSGAAAAQVPAAPAGPTYKEVTLPAGTTLALELRSAVASDTSNPEDVVRAQLREPIVVDGATVVPAGDQLQGVVTDAERSGRVKGRAHVAFRFNSLEVDGERYDISTETISHMAPATKGEDAKKIAIGAGAGAAVGAILGGGSGAAKGAAIGGAGGTGAVLATRGEEARLGPGASVTARLSAPVTIRVKVD
jgi:hypothetical protein